MTAPTAQAWLVNINHDSTNATVLLEDALVMLLMACATPIVLAYTVLWSKLHAM